MKQNPKNRVEKPILIHLGDRTFLFREINHFELPVVSLMVHPTETDGPEFHEVMLDSLIHDARQGSVQSIYALQMIHELHRRWVEATDKLFEINEIVER